MTGVRLNKAELIERFGMSSLMVIRVGALLAQRVDITEAVLELAGPGSATEKMLRRPEVLSQAQTLDTALIAALAEQTQADQEAAFVVVASQEWRTIALGEELLAEQAWAEAAGPQDEGATSAQGNALAPAKREFGLAPGAIDPHGVCAVFSGEQIAELKLTALTSADSGQKVEAMRKLMFAPISEHEKGAVLLKILVDPVSEARVEAVSGLRALGFDPRLAEAVTALLEGHAGGRVFAADRIGRLLPQVGEHETYVVVELLLEQLREAESPEVAESIMRATRGAGPFLARSDDHLKALADACVLRLATGESGLAAAARDVLLDVGRYAPEHVARVLWQQVETTEARDIQSFLMTTVCQLDMGDELAGKVARSLVDALLGPEVSQEDRLRLRYGAARLGAACVDPLLERLATAAPEGQCIVIGVLDAIATERPVAAEVKTRVAQRMLDTLKVASNQVSVHVLQSRICADEEIDRDVKIGLAREFLASLREFHLPDVRERITATLARIGPHCAAAMLDFVEDAPNDETSALAMRVLAKVAEDHATGWDAQDAARAIDLCMACWHDEGVTHGAYAFALAHLCAAGLAPPEVTRQLGREFQDRLGDSAYTIELLEALGVLAGSGNCELEQKVAMAQLFITLLERKPPEEVGSEMSTDDGVVYVFGKETDFDAVVLPMVVDGLGRICLSPNTSRNLRDRIIMSMLDVWGSVTQYKVVWGPMAIDALTRVVGRVGSHESTSLPYRVHIARVLCRHVDRMAVVRSVGGLFHRGGASPELDELALEAAANMIEEWDVPDIADDERAAFLISLGRTLGRRDLDPTDRAVRVLRRRAIDLLFDALKDGVFAVREALTVIKECPTLPQKQRDEIEDRLSKSFGLVHRASGPGPR